VLSFVHGIKIAMMIGMETQEGKPMSPNTPTLYDALKEANVPTDSHESDLYFLRTPEALEILKRFPTQGAVAQSFRSCLDGKLWVDVPFAYQPWWDKREKRHER